MTCAQKEGLLSEAAAEEVGIFKPVIGEYVPKTSQDSVISYNSYVSYKKCTGLLLKSLPKALV